MMMGDDGGRGGVLFPDRETKTAIKRKTLPSKLRVRGGCVSKNNTVREREKGPGITVRA